MRCDEPDANDCEPGPNGARRVKARVIASRYLDSMKEARHGIVLFHDRVGDVGSRYALDVAERVIRRSKRATSSSRRPCSAFSRPRGQPRSR